MKELTEILLALFSAYFLDQVEVLINALSGFLGGCCSGPKGVLPACLMARCRAPLFAAKRSEKQNKANDQDHDYTNEGH